MAFKPRTMKTHPVVRRDPLDAVEIEAEDFCQCEHPISSDWGPELCGRCKRIVLFNWDVDPEGRVDYYGSLD